MRNHNHYNRYILWLTIFLSSLGFSLYSVIFSLYLYELGASFTQITLLVAIPNLVSLLFARFWGILSDELHAYKLFVTWSYLVSAIFVFFYGLTKNITLILTLFILATILSSPGSPALNAIVTTVGEKESRGRIVGVFISSDTMGYAIGSFLSAYLIVTIGVSKLFPLSAVIIALSAIFFILFYHEERDHRLLQKDVIMMALKKTFSPREFYADRELIPLISAIAVFNIGTTAFFEIFVFKYYIVIGRNLSLYAIVSGISSVLSAIAPPIYGFIGDKIGLDNLLLIMMFIRIIYMLSLALIWDPLILTILWILPIWAGLYLSSITLATNILGDEKAGRAQGTLSMTTQLSNMIGALAAGYLADKLGARRNISRAMPIYLGSIILCIIGLIIFASYLKKKRSSNE